MPTSILFIMQPFSSSDLPLESNAKIFVEAATLEQAYLPSLPATDRSAFLIETLPPEARAELETMLYGKTLTEEPLGYVLFFGKPAGWLSVSAIPERYQGQLNIEGLPPIKLAPDYVKMEHNRQFNQELMRGIAAWNFMLPEGSNIAFTTTRRELFDPPGAAANGTRHVFVFNIPRALEAIAQNIDIFQAAIGEKASAVHILQSILSCDSITELLRNHQGAFGILLGFGRHNAMEYHHAHLDGTDRDRKIVGIPVSETAAADLYFHETGNKSAMTGFASFEGSERRAYWNYLLARQRYVISCMVKQPDLLQRAVCSALNPLPRDNPLSWPLFTDAG